MSECHVIEFCICAAIRMPDGEVIHGHRHNNCYDVVRARANTDREAIVKAEQGFVTSIGRFVDRIEAMQIQKASGRKSHYHPSGKYFGDQLFSEDLYPDGPVSPTIWQPQPDPLLPTAEPQQPTRNSEALTSFVSYCQRHPSERFWQALRNWSRFDYIFGSFGSGHISSRACDINTFNIEGLNGTRTPEDPL